jgi:drug/metabolite transporter (DMT)-like permease
MYVLGAGLWLLVLSKVDVSLAYPFVGLGFIMTMLLGWLFLHEGVGVERIIGTLLIAGGVVLVSRS